MTAATMTTDTITDTITVVRAPCRRLTKLIHADGTIDDYELVRHVDLAEREILGLDELGRLLAGLQSQTDKAVVRGAIADTKCSKHVRRLLHADRETGELPTLIERPRRWAALDFDHVARPAHIDVADIEVCGEIVVALLPEPFRYAGCIIQATSGHAIRGIRLRLWHWFDRPVSGAELKYWLAKVPVDPAPFRAAQLIYTAAPMLASGVRDPLPARLAWRTGSPRVRVPPARELQAPPRRPAPIPPACGSVGSGDYAATMLTRALVRIGRAGTGRRNPTLFTAACGLAPLIKRGLFDETTVTEALIGAAKRAGLDNEPHRDAEREAKKAVAWALGHVS
jgi:hypothetical protein